MSDSASRRGITLGRRAPNPLLRFDEELSPDGFEFDITSRYLLEPGDDWDPAWARSVGVSPLAAARIAVLVGWIEDVLSEPTLTSLQLDLTVGYEPDGIVALSFSEAPARITGDVLRESPPCLRYVITRDGSSDRKETQP